MPQTTTYPNCTPCCQPTGGFPTSCCPDDDVAGTLDLTLANGTGDYRQLDGVSFPVTYDTDQALWTDHGAHVYQCLDGADYSTFEFACVGNQFHLACHGGCSFDSAADPSQVSCAPFAVGGHHAGTNGSFDWTVTP